MLAVVEAQAGRGLELPGAEVQRLAERGEGGWREAGGLEEREELGGERGVLGAGQLHGEEHGLRVLAGLGVGEREVLLGREGRRERVGVGPEEHGVREFRAEADLPQARDDFLEARGCAGLLRLDSSVWLVLEVARLDPEPVMALGGLQELVFQRGQAPAGWV